MRFKFRTDLERVYETLNNRHFGQFNSSIIDKQLKDLNLVLGSPTKRRNDKPSLDDMETSEKESEEAEEEVERLQYVEDEGIPQQIVKKQKKKFNFVDDYKTKVKRKFVDNSGAKKLFYELHRKTFFKAANTLVINPPKRPEIINKDNVKIEKKKPFVFKKQITKKKDPKSQTIENYFRKIPINSTNMDIIKGNPLLYNINFNPMKKVDMEDYDEKRFELLKKLSVTYKLRTSSAMTGFEQNATIKGTKFTNSIKTKDNFRADSLILSDPFVFFSSFKANEALEGRKEKDIERIMIDGKVYPKYEIEIITKKILSKCKYVKDKKK